MQSRQRNAARRRYGAEVGTPAARCNNHSLCCSPTGWDGPVPVRLAARRGGTAPSPSGSRKNYVISARTSKSRGKTRPAEGRQLGFCRAREALCPDERGSGAEMTYFFQRAVPGRAGRAGRRALPPSARCAHRHQPATHRSVLPSVCRYGQCARPLTMFRALRLRFTTLRAATKRVDVTQESRTHIVNSPFRLAL